MKLALLGLTLIMLPLAGGCREEARGPSADTYPVRGIDVSVHNGEIDFERVREAGVSFAIIKATEGTDWQDRNLTRNYARARRAGLKVGLYHFFRFNTPGRLQALNLIEATATRPVDLPLVIDIEEFGNPRFTPTRQVLAKLDTCIATLTEAGHRVMLYTNKRGYQRFIEGRYDSIPLWLSSLDEGSPDFAPWILWQHSHRGTVEGIDGPSDLNVFTGDSAAFAAFAGGNRHKKADISSATQ
ncbi:MAG: hypothetical protein NC342_08970 [Pseudoflavonifractor sp.]|nr:hypothetical protein [Alloprevotella sp.]MCM1117652.1 hypothetical protein [Pseudoflavonifractor sp.]